MLKDEIYRKILGGALGAGLGLAYGLVADTVNQLLLWGIPLYHPLGLGLVLVLWTVAGLALGLLCTWPHESLPGIALSSVFAGILTWSVTFTQGGSDMLTTLTKLFSALYLFLPLTALIVPFIGLLRWIINKLLDLRLDYPESKWRMVLPAIPVILGGVLGSFSAYPAYGRIMVQDMDVMLAQAARAASLEELPRPLRHYRVENYLPSNRASYALEWLEVDVNDYALALPGAQSGMSTSAVVARYADGYYLLCIFAEAGAEPACLGYPVGALP